jgi:CRISPR/Cas system Type II protein with McrA/HNH and RuvC-like nuclease domain
MCVYCGARGDVEVEHVEPISRGGTDTPDNRTLACFPCNRGKGNQLILEWVWGAPRQKRPNGWLRNEVARRLRKKPGLGITELARAIGTRPDYIRASFRRWRRPSPEQEET